MTAVVGLDLSLTATGVAHTNGSTSTIKTSLLRGDGRLEDIFTTVVSALSRADLAVMEDLPYNARQAGSTGMVQGVVRLALIRKGVPYALLSPATLKKFSAGNGRADKADMAAALLEFYGNPVIEPIGRGGQYLPLQGVELTDDNQVDAAWLRLAGLTWLGLEPALADRRHILETGKWAGWSDSYAL